MKKRRGCAGLSYGFPAHLLDAAEIVDELWKSFSSETVINCFLKSEMLSENHFYDLVMKSKKFRQRYNIPEPPQQNNNSSANDVDEEQTIGEIMRAMHVLRQVPITPSVGGNFSSIPEIADDNIFFNKSIGENAAISDAEAREAISRWIGIEDEPDILAELVEIEFNESTTAAFNDEYKSEDDTNVQVLAAEGLTEMPSVQHQIPSKSEVLSAMSVISEYCEAKKMTEASKLFAQFERKFTSESSASAKQLSLFDIIKK